MKREFHEKPPIIRDLPISESCKVMERRSLSAGHEASLSPERSRLEDVLVVKRRSSSLSSLDSRKCGLNASVSRRRASKNLTDPHSDSETHPGVESQEFDEQLKTKADFERCSVTRGSISVSSSRLLKEIRVTCCNAVDLRWEHFRRLDVTVENESDAVPDEDEENDTRKVLSCAGLVESLRLVKRVEKWLSGEARMSRISEALRAVELCDGKSLGQGRHLSVVTGWAHDAEIPLEMLCKIVVTYGTSRDPLPLSWVVQNVGNGREAEMDSHEEVYLRFAHIGEIASVEHIPADLGDGKERGMYVVCFENASSAFGALEDWEDRGMVIPSTKRKIVCVHALSALQLAIRDVNPEGDAASRQQQLERKHENSGKVQDRHHPQQQQKQQASSLSKKRLKEEKGGFSLTILLKDGNVNEEDVMELLREIDVREAIQDTHAKLDASTEEFRGLSISFAQRQDAEGIMSLLQRNEKGKSLNVELQREENVMKSDVKKRRSESSQVNDLTAIHIQNGSQAVPEAGDLKENPLSEDGRSTCSSESKRNVKSHKKTCDRETEHERLRLELERKLELRAHEEDSFQHNTDELAESFRSQIAFSNPEHVGGLSRADMQAAYMNMGAGGYYYGPLAQQGQYYAMAPPHQQQSPPFPAWGQPYPAHHSMVMPSGPQGFPGYSVPQTMGPPPVPASAPVETSRLHVSFQHPMPQRVLYELFQQSAPGLEYVSRHTDKCFAFVKFAAEVSAQLAMLRLDGKEVHGNVLSISIAQPPRNNGSENTRKRQRT